MHVPRKTRNCLLLAVFFLLVFKGFSLFCLHSRMQKSLKFSEHLMSYLKVALENLYLKPSLLYLNVQVRALVSVFVSLSPYMYKLGILCFINCFGMLLYMKQVTIIKNNCYHSQQYEVTAACTVLSKHQECCKALWQKYLRKSKAKGRLNGRIKCISYLKNVSFKNVMPQFHCLLTVKFSFLTWKEEGKKSMPIPKGNNKNDRDKFKQLPNKSPQNISIDRSSFSLSSA